MFCNVSDGFGTINLSIVVQIASVLVGTSISEGKIAGKLSQVDYLPATIWQHTFFGVYR